MTSQILEFNCEREKKKVIALVIANMLGFLFSFLGIWENSFISLNCSDYPISGERLCLKNH